jgi:outer membrane protein assembly factor BamB
MPQFIAQPAIRADADGTMDGWFNAVNARTGELLWRYKVDRR